MKASNADVAVIGGGVIGCGIARELARRGQDVILIERDSPGRRATWAAAGMLSPFGEDVSSAFLNLADDSLQRFAEFAQAVHEESGIDVEFRTTGKLYISLGNDDDRLRALAADAHADRFEITLVDGSTARALEPALTDQVSLALLIGRDHRVNNRLLAQALLAAGTAASVRFRTGAPVAAVLTHGEHVAGLRLASGEQINAPRVVLAAGAWSGMLEGLPRAVPIRPVKGQMFSVDARVAGERSRELAMERVIFSSSCYIIPREDGRLLVGATVEDVGFRKGATPRGLSFLMQAASMIVPTLADMPLIETWAGFRPASPDGLPILGEDPLLKGFFYATGHFRNGILLAPVTAVCIADLVTGSTPSHDLTDFGIERFETAHA
jgi:glycine oxidase